jgi:hypothetical protein
MADRRRHYETYSMRKISTDRPFNSEIERPINCWIEPWPAQFVLEQSNWLLTDEGNWRKLNPLLSEYCPIFRIHDAYNKIWDVSIRRKHSTDVDNFRLPVICTKSIGELHFVQRMKHNFIFIIYIKKLLILSRVLVTIEGVRICK